MNEILAIIGTIVLLYIGSCIFWYVVSKIEEWFMFH